MGCSQSSVSIISDYTIQEDIYNYSSSGDVVNLERCLDLLSHSINVGNGQSLEWYYGVYQKDQAIHKAAAKNYVDCVRLLIERGANVDARNKYGNTPAHRACAQGCIDCVSLLIDNGADLNSKNDDGDTLLHYAVRNGREEVIKLLLERGADMDIKNNSDLTPENFSFFNSPKSLRGSFFKSKINVLFEEEKAKRAESEDMQNSSLNRSYSAIDASRDTSNVSIISRSMSEHELYKQQ